jgi:hypothetical protein
MYIDVHSPRVKFYIESVDRLALSVQHIFIGTANCVAQDFVANKAAIDIAKLVVGAGARSIRNAGAAPDPDAV